MATRTSTVARVRTSGANHGAVSPARTGGHLAIIGAVAGFENDAMPFAIVQAKRLRLQGVTVGCRRDQLDMIRAIEAADLHPVIDRAFGLADIADAFDHMRGGEPVGKVCLEI